MSYPEPGLANEVVRAAELRAEGQSWEQVARALGCPQLTVRKWSEEYPAFWADHLETARIEVREQANDEAVAVLRTLLRSEDDKVRRDAARELVRHAAPRTPVADRPRPPRPLRPPWMLDNCD